MKNFNFHIEKTLESGGRAGYYDTPHGRILTPTFVAVGTKSTVKSMTPEMLIDIGIQVVLANTYHLYLQPGDEIIAQAGGFPKWMNWHGPTMTDSGGFQVFSLGAAYGKSVSKVATGDDLLQLNPGRSGDDIAPLAKVGSDGVSFRSHIDGSLHYLTPRRSMEIQKNLGADIIFAFDECTSPTETYEYQKESLIRTHKWAQESLEVHTELDPENMQALFGVVQGAQFEDLRKLSAEELANMKASNGREFEGFGIGGSFSKDDMTTAVDWVTKVLPNDKPRHLLGIGEPLDLFMGVEQGIDFFDCVAPTRMARHGTVYTNDGRLNLMNEKCTTEMGPIDGECKCYTCKNFTQSYVAHLFRAKEMLAATLASIHNMYFINKLVQNMRQAILDDTFAEYKKEFLARYYK